MLSGKRIPNDDQLASAVASVVAEGAAAGARAIDVSTWDGIDLRLLPDRGLDIGAAAELVFEHVGATWARLTSPALRLELTLRSSLPRLWQWVNPAAGTSALAIEPSNCTVLGREHDVATGQMPFLDPGEARSSWVTIAATRLPA